MLRPYFCTWVVVKLRMTNSTKKYCICCNTGFVCGVWVRVTYCINSGSTCDGFIVSDFMSKFLSDSITSGPIPSPGNRAIFISIRILFFSFVTIFDLFYDIKHFFGGHHGRNGLVTIQTFGLEDPSIQIPSNHTFYKSIHNSYRIF